MSTGGPERLFEWCGLVRYWNYWEGELKAFYDTLHYESLRCLLLAVIVQEDV